MPSYFVVLAIFTNNFLDQNAIKRNVSTSGDASLLHGSVANECLEKIGRYPGDVTERTYKRAIFYYYVDVDTSRDRTLLRRNAPRKCIERCAAVTGRDRSSIFVSLKRAAITRFMAVIDNAYLGLCAACYTRSTLCSSVM